MRAAIRTLRTFLVVSLATVAGCEKSEPSQNIVITNEIPANADVEALPPDESSATPSNELINGADNADVSELNDSGNAY